LVRGRLLVVVANIVYAVQGIYIYTIEVVFVHSVNGNLIIERSHNTLAGRVYNKHIMDIVDDKKKKVILLLFYTYKNDHDIL